MELVRSRPVFANSDFPQLARDAEQGCPVSNALRGSLVIDVEAQAI